MQQPADDDSTINLKELSRPARKPSRFPIVAGSGAAMALLLMVAGAWLLWPSAPPPRDVTRHIVLPAPPAAIPVPGPDPAQSPPAANTEVAVVPPATTAIPPVVAPPTSPAAPDAASEPPAPDFHIETATEQHVLNHVEAETPPGITVFRFKPNPRILVLDFGSLREQGHMLNRAAALVEKAGLPRDHLLSDTELDNAVQAAGDTVETFYYGHDYGAPSLVRFFSLADRENITLTGEEEQLRRLLRQDGWFAPNTRAALITIPRVGADEHVTRLARATILHHELSHGEYFTNPAYAAFVHHFWTHTLTEAERQQIRTHLHSLGYDSALDELMENEAQAYLMFTEDAEFFTPDMVGMTRGRLAELRGGFYRAMPAGWLRDSLGQTLGINKTAASHP